MAKKAETFKLSGIAPEFILTIGFGQSPYISLGELREMHLDRCSEESQRLVKFVQVLWKLGTSWDFMEILVQID